MENKKIKITHNNNEKIVPLNYFFDQNFILMEKGDKKMKKSFYIFISILFLVFTIFMTSFVFAATLDDVTIDVNKTKVEPGQEITVTTNFGKSLGAYTIDVAYDDAIFDYVRSEGGTENDNGTRVRLTYYDQTGGTNPRTSASITFKAKENITSSNQTDFAVTLEGLANANASETYDDILTPIKKEIIVEPNYADYTLSLQYTGDIQPILLKDMSLSIASTMGRNYEHARLLADVKKAPTNGTVELFATNSQKSEVDLIKDGWGGTDGFSIGGANSLTQLQLRGAFSKVGEYTIHFKLIDKDNSDSVIVEKSFDLVVGTQDITPDDKNENTTIPGNQEENLPESLPKTGGMQYFFIILSVITLVISYYIITKKDRK